MSLSTSNCVNVKFCMDVELFTDVSCILLVLIGGCIPNNNPNRVTFTD